MPEPTALLQMLIIQLFYLFLQNPRTFQGG